MRKCPNCFGTGSYTRKNKKEHCKKCDGKGVLETIRKEARSNIPKLANQVPYYQVFEKKRVNSNCCNTSIRFLGLKIDEPETCECGIIEVTRIYEKMIDITIVPEKETETILI